MAKNFVQDDDVIQWTNGTGANVVSGQMIKVGPGLLGVALVDIASTASGSVALRGVFSAIAKVSAAVFVKGEKLDIAADRAKLNADGKK